MPVPSTLMDTITVLEASRRTGIPVREIYSAIDAKRIEGYRIGDEVHVRPDQVAALAS